MSYILSGPGVIHEMLSDEVIIANLDVGIYYSIRGSGIQIWQLLLEGHTVCSIEALLSKKYGTVPSIVPFVSLLLEERLLVEEECSNSSTSSVAWPAMFQQPMFERYDEMKNLLMLDPIHEVDEQGWPRQK